jgi:hypothetical protein
MRRTQLRHLVTVAEGAARENPDLAQKFVLAREDTPYIEFQVAARAMLAEAQNQKELLVKHGLVETLLDGLVKNMEAFDQAIGQGTEGRRIHVNASSELDLIGDEVVHLVKVMDALNRFRFDDAFNTLAEWESASNVFGPVHPAADKPETPVQSSPIGSQEKPAA